MMWCACMKFVHGVFASRFSFVRISHAVVVNRPADLATYFPWLPRPLATPIAVNRWVDALRHLLLARPPLARSEHSVESAAQMPPPSPMCFAPCVPAMSITICAGLARGHSGRRSTSFSIGGTRLFPATLPLWPGARKHRHCASATLSWHMRCPRASCLATQPCVIHLTLDVCRVRALLLQSIDRRRHRERLRRREHHRPRFWLDERRLHPPRGRCQSSGGGDGAGLATFWRPRRRRSAAALARPPRWPMRASEAG